MIQVAAAVEYYFRYAFGQRLFSNGLAYGLGSFHVAAVVFETLFHSAGCGNRFARFIVDDLCVDVAQGTIYIQTGSFRRTNDIFAGYDVSDAFRSCLLS